MEFWYHGTEEHFSKWGDPPVKSKYKPELHPHPFVSLKKDKILATDAGENSGGLCRAKLHDGARVLDLRIQSDDNIELWNAVKASEIGRYHSYIQSFDLWLLMCRNGKILRFQSDYDRLVAPLEMQMMIANSETHPFRQRQEAFLQVQNFTRRWINTVITPARQLGYHAAICSEFNSDHPSGPMDCLNLYVFNVNILTDPEWLSLPHVSRIG